MLRVALAQINATVGDFEGNLNKILISAQQADQLRADIIVFPELALCGYPPEDLLLRQDFLKDNQKCLKQVVKASRDLAPMLLLGFADVQQSVYNASALIYAGKLWDVYYKQLLPNYGVFDEKRYFSAGQVTKIYQTKDFRFGISICEDAWKVEGPIRPQIRAGAECVCILNASPFEIGKTGQRLKIVRQSLQNSGVPAVYVNLVGGQDELIFDGQSFAVDSKAKVATRLAGFREDLRCVDLILPKKGLRPNRTVKVVKIPYKQSQARPHLLNSRSDMLESREETYQALRMGLADYVRKNGFKQVILGLSGGIDSALVATLAVDALGPENVHAVYMPTQYSARQSLEDSKQLAQNLSIDFRVLSVEGLFRNFLRELKPHFVGLKPDVTEENLQARLRGIILMALSNKFGWLVLATSNKSETSVGYATLYGDMVGGYSPLKDVSKTLVWELSRWRNLQAGKQIIPEATINRPPTAELRANQLDTDSLPAYDQLDSIIHYYVEEELDLESVAKKSGAKLEVVRKYARMIDRAEYKRAQAAPGPKITRRAFGKERRMPITKK